MKGLIIPFMEVAKEIEDAGGKLLILIASQIFPLAQGMMDQG